MSVTSGSLRDGLGALVHLQPAPGWQGEQAVWFALAKPALLKVKIARKMAAPAPVH